MKNVFSRMLWHFDRTFVGNGKKVWGQLGIIIGLTVILVFIIASIGQIVMRVFNIDFCNWLQNAIVLAFKATSLPLNGNNTYPFWWQTVAYLLGTIIFNGAIIAFVSNWLNNRLKAYREGTARYKFDNHVLFLGGSRIFLPMLKVIGSDDELKNSDVVVLTSDKVERVRVDIVRYLEPKLLKKMKITVLSGDHYDKETLESVYSNRAKKLYIVGDYLSGSEHDSENVACWEFVRELCSGRENVPCYLYFARSSSLQMFYRRKTSTNGCLDTTVLNYLESMTQQVLVHNGNENRYYPRLDRNGIGPDSERTVHLVICGMTSVSYAIAATAAQLCHFPNSVNQSTLDINPSRCTKITFIAPDMKRGMGFLTSHLDSLFKMSYYTYVYKENQDGEVHKPDLKYGDFLDIEWEFIDGNITEDWVRERIKGYYNNCVNDKKTYLSMAFCEMEKPDNNIAGAVYLPKEFHQIVRSEDKKINWEKTIPIFVFQPQNEVLVRNAQREVPLYENVFSFGSIRESYDPSIRQRIHEGKRINYIYEKGLDYLYMTSDQNELDSSWRSKTFLEQVSNIYCANHIGVKLRSMNVDEDALRRKDKIPASYVPLMAAVEHNRWNIEKLLVGFDPIEESVRKNLKAKEKQGGQEFEDEKKRLKDLKKDQYEHYCIAPFNELLNSDKEYDFLIVKNLTDVLQ